MTSQRKLRAHRANARSGTGRKPPRGVRKRGKNAHRHGLAIPVMADPVKARSNLAALDRDERRALSRHKSAIQLFDAFRVASLTGAQTPDECP
jgi:hypothetical protein